MRLAEIVEEIARALASAAHAAGWEHVREIESATEHTAQLPGKPSCLEIMPLSPLMPETIRLEVPLWVGTKNGDVVVRMGGRRFRKPKLPGTLEVTMVAGEPAEAVCRLRDTLDHAHETRVRSELYPLEEAAE